MLGSLPFEYDKHGVKTALLKRGTGILQEKDKWLEQCDVSERCIILTVSAFLKNK
jgi:hypothetical protein